MEPITATVIAALVAGATAGAKDVATSAIKDSYAWLKKLVVKKDAKSGTAIAALEAKPDSPAELTALATQLGIAGMTKDDDIAKAAQALLDAIRNEPAAAKVFDLERVKVFRDFEATDIDAIGTILRARDVEIGGSVKLSGIRQHAPPGAAPKN